MKTLHMSVSAVLLLSLLSEANLSNPDSEIFQDPSNDKNAVQRNPRSSSPGIMYDRQSSMISRESSGFRISTIRDLKQVRTGNVLVMWRPVGYLVRVNGGSTNRNNRPDLVVATEDKPGSNPNDYNPVSNGPEIPGDSFPGSLIPSSAEFKPTNNMNGPNGVPSSVNTPNITGNGYGYGYGYSYSGNVPFGTRTNSNGPRNRNVQNVRPTQIPSGSYPRFSVGPNYGNREPGSKTPHGNTFPNRESSQPSETPAGGTPVHPTGGFASRSPSQRPQSFPGNVHNPNNEISPDSNFFAGIINDFAFKLVDELNLEGNFVISPLSIFISLSMCYLGSDGSTKAQLESVLGLNENGVHGSRLHQGVHDLRTLITSRSSDYQLFLANGVFLNKNLTINPEYKADIERYYSGESQELDFTNPDVSVPIINAWVSKETNNMIRTFLDSPPDPLARVLMLSAVYFKGIWKTQFPVQLTYEGNFFPVGGSSKRIPMMILYNNTFPYHRSDEYKHTFIQLPYQGDQISMIIALPNSFDDAPMPKITDQIICSLRDSMTNTRLDTITIPKFRLEFVSLLKNALQQLGITNMFDPRVVDLSKMRRQNDIVVSKITHKALIEINEQGTTASAVTSVSYMPLSYSNTTDFIVNRPFAFYLIHEQSGLVLFYGKVNDISDEMVDISSLSSRQGGMQGRRPGTGMRG